MKWTSSCRFAVDRGDRRASPPQSSNGEHDFYDTVPISNATAILEMTRADHAPPSFFVEVPHAGRWEETSTAAWRELVRFGMSHGARYYGLICDAYAQPDTRISRYRKLRRREHLAEIYASSRQYGEEITIEREGGLMFADFIRLSHDSGPLLIDISRSNGHSFVMVSLGTELGEHDVDVVKTTIRNGYDAGRSISIDDDRTAALFDDPRLLAVRSSGEFDDRHLRLSL